MELQSRYIFRWRCSYLNELFYEVIGDDRPYEVAIRLGPTNPVRCSSYEYERSITNRDYRSDDVWEAMIMATIDGIRREGDPREPIAGDVIDAFNTWRAAQHARCIARIEADPWRYGELPPDDPLRQPPPVVQGIALMYDAGGVTLHGRQMRWVITHRTEAAAPIALAA